MTEGEKDRRRHHRFGAAGKSEIVLLDENGKAVKRSGKSLNMSVGGLLLHTAEKLPLGATVLLKLDINEPSEGKLEAVGVVTRVTEHPGGGYDIAINFEGAQIEDTAALLEANKMD
jgi:hypothetical protein